MKITSQHIDQFLKKSRNANWAGAFYSAPFQTDFQFLLQDLNLVQTGLTDEFIFYPFAHQKTPKVVLKPQYKNVKAVEQLLGETEGSGFWYLSELLKEKSTTIEDYEKQFEKYISEIRSGKCEKAILSTITRSQIPSNYSVGEFIFRLREEYPQSFIYLFSSPITGTWIGATPETFLKWNGNEISTMSLAGTKKQGAENFQFGNKEKQEQEIVTQYIEDIFAKYLTEVKAEEAIEFNYGEMVHLITKITAKAPLHFSKEDLLRLCYQFHPTPAVGGYPKENALALIAGAEPHSRFYYSGYLGPISEGSTELAVNLRCMSLTEDEIFVFAGGGITKDSNVESEWAETRLKAQALLKFL